MPISFACLALFSVFVSPTKVHADPRADANVADGTDLHPFPTLKAAVDAAVKRRAKHPDEAIDVVLAEGVREHPEWLK